MQPHFPAIVARVKPVNDGHRLPTTEPAHMQSLDRFNRSIRHLLTTPKSDTCGRDVLPPVILLCSALIFSDRIHSSRLLWQELEDGGGRLDARVQLKIVPNLAGRAPC